MAEHSPETQLFLYSRIPRSAPLRINGQDQERNHLARDSVAARRRYLPRVRLHSALIHVGEHVARVLSVRKRE